MRIHVLTWRAGAIIVHGMEKRIAIGLKLPPSLVRQVDDIRSHWEYPVERTAIIERALRDWVEKNRNDEDGAVNLRDERGRAG